MAVKLVTWEVSPDGATAEEVAINASLTHPNLTRVLALVVVDEDGNASAVGGAGSAGASDSGGGGGGGIVGMVLELVQGAPLAGRPTSQHLLRCKWEPDRVFDGPTALQLCHGVASALAYLHSCSICHGAGTLMRVTSTTVAPPTHTHQNISKCSESVSIPPSHTFIWDASLHR